MSCAAAAWAAKAGTTRAGHGDDAIATTPPRAVPEISRSTDRTRRPQSVARRTLRRPGQETDAVA